VFLRPLYRRPVTDKVTAESIIFITWAFYITIFKKYRVSMTKTVQEYQVGIKVASMYSPLSPDEAIIMAGRKMIQLSFTMIKSLGLLLSGQVPIEAVGGPILIAYQADHHARKGVGALIMFVAIISLSLAIINLLPIPMLDGGILFFLLIGASLLTSEPYG